MSTAHTFHPNIHAQAQDFPAVGPTGMRFLHLYQITKGKHILASFVNALVV
ncbi:hypothetical protein FD09_GL001992 [Schleiferilactobacillus perolens DSM 12744]|uniref:Uncharacterized protein n=1 Tax=Schleiferilactobacillus perolens DSM 12744 TaxID=1423792 RepID=A0A0R1N7X3_9LACO|nr:hypothetical protein FD09_GL001992 [Schleiferilactobacillus perolens DSM 12744]